MGKALVSETRFASQLYVWLGEAGESLRISVSLSVQHGYHPPSRMMSTLYLLYAQYTGEAQQHACSLRAQVISAFTCTKTSPVRYRRPFSYKPKEAGGLPWWLSDKESIYQCRRRGYDP